jgi:hypothetical protein
MQPYPAHLLVSFSGLNTMELTNAGNSWRNSVHHCWYGAPQEDTLVRKSRSSRHRGAFRSSSTRDNRNHSCKQQEHTVADHGPTSQKGSHRQMIQLKRVAKGTHWIFKVIIHCFNIYCSLTPWSRVLLEKLKIIHLVNSLSFLEPKWPFPCSQEPTSGP